MKKIKYIALLLLITLIFSVPVFSAGKQRLVDQDQLLSTEEAEELTSILDKISEKQQFDLVVVTTPSLDGMSAEAYADEFYDSHGYGYGSEQDGALLLLAMNEREYYISTKGYGMTAYTIAGMEYMEDKFVPKLSDGEYFEAFATFANLSDNYITEAKNGTPYDTGHLPKGKRPFGPYALFSALIAAVVSFISGSSKKAALKSVTPQNYANHYVSNNHMTNTQDVFLFHNIVRTPRPKQEDHKSGGSGSGAHVSSNGSLHGGHGGKF